MLRTILLAIIAVVVLAAGTLAFVDLGRFQGFIVYLASGYLEREVTIDGPLSIQLGRKLTISARDTRVASTDWSAEPDLVTIDEISLVVDTASMLSGMLVIDELQAGGIRAHLAVNEAGEDNYSFAAFESEDDEATMPVVLKFAKVSNLSIGYSHPALPRQKLAFSSIELREAPQGDLRFELTGNLNDTPLTATGTAGPLSNIIGGMDVGLELSGRLGEISLTASGRIDDLVAPRSPTAAFAIEAPDAEYLTGILGIDPVTTGPLDLKGNLAPAGGRVKVGVDGTFGEFEVQLTASLADLQTPNDLDLVLDASGPSAATVARIAGHPDFPPLPFTVEAAGRIEGERLQIERLSVDIGAAQLEATGELPRFPALDEARLQLTARGPQFGDFNRLAGLPGRLTGPFQINARLVQTVSGEGAVLAEVMAEAIQLRLNGEISPDPALVGSRFDVEADAEDVSVLAGAFDLESVPPQPAGVRTTLTLREGAIDLQDGEATLGAERLAFEGTVGLDPFSSLTGFRASTRIASVHAFLKSLGLAVPDVPDGPLAVSTDVAHDESAFLIKAFTARFDDSMQADVNGRIGDAFELANLEFDVRGNSLSTIVPRGEIKIDKPFRVSGKFGLASEDAFEVTDVKVSVGNARASGKLTASTNLRSGRASVEANAPRLGELIPSIARYLPPKDALVVRGEGRWQDKRLWLQPLDVTLGASRIGGTVSVRPPTVPEHLPIFDVKLRSPLLDLRALQSDTAKRARDIKLVTDPSARLIPDTPVPVAALDQLQGTFDLAADEVKLRNTALRKVVLKGRVGDGALRLSRFALAGQRGGSLAGRVSVVRRGSGVDLSFRADGAKLVMGLPAKTRKEVELLPEYEIRTEVKARGATVRELAASITGYLRMVAGKGRLDLAAVGLLSRDFASQVLSAVNPLVRQERLSRVQCMAVLIEAVDGVVFGEPALVFQSDKLNITGVGRVDLRSEKLNANFNTQPREGLGVSLTDLVSPLTEIGGTLNRPTLQLDAKGVLVEGTAAVATLGVSFLAKRVRDRLFSDPQPCRRAIREADADLKSR